MTTTTLRIPYRWSAVRPTPERVAATAQRFAEQHDAEVAEVTPLTVGRTRRNSTCWDATIVLRKAARSARE